MSVERIPIKSRGQWLALREHDVTASDVAALFGLHQFRTLLQVYMSKIGSGEGDQGDNAAMRRGRILEPGVAVAVEEERPDWRLVKPGEYLRDTVARIGATPDYYLHGDERGIGIVECKTAAPDVFERDWASGAPQGYVLQCLTQMMLAGAPFGIVACLVDNRAKDLFLYDVPRHAKAETLIRHKVAQFWTAIAQGKMPSPDYQRDADAIKALFPKDNGRGLDLSHDNRIGALLDDRERVKAALDGAKEQLEAIDTEIKHKLGEHAEASAPGWRISHKLQKRKSYTVAETEFRVLRCTKLKADKEAAE